MLFKLKVAFYYLTFRFAKKLRDRRAIEGHQLKMMNKFAQKVLRKSPFYSRFFEGKTFNWNKAPIADKTFFMEHFDEINIAGIKKEEAIRVALSAELSRDFTPTINGITVGLSTGTSGKRGMFLASETERAKWAAIMMQIIIKPKFLKRQHIAFFLRANSNLYASINSIFFKFKYYDIFKSISSFVTDLNTYRPCILTAQPSVLVELAELKNKGLLNINPVKIVSYAEVLNDSDRVFIEKAFGLNIAEVYQCTEGFLGYSCQYGVMHLNENFVHFDKEYIAERRFYPIVTDFTRFVQPVVRYRLNDILIEKAEPCACGSGFIAIEKIEGRDEDVLLFIDDGKVIKLFPDIISRKIAQLTNDFRRYKIEQKDYTTLHIFIEAEDILDTRDFFKTAFTELFLEHGIKDISLLFFDEISHPIGTKYRKISRTFIHKPTDQYTTVNTKS